MAVIRDYCRYLDVSRVLAVFVWYDDTLKKYIWKLVWDVVGVFALQSGVIIRRYVCD